MSFDSNVIGMLVAAFVALTPIYSMMYDMKKDMGEMKKDTAKLSTTISLCPNCPHKEGED